MAKEVLPSSPISASPASSTTTTPLTVTGILREAIKLPTRNGKLMLQIMLLVLSPFSLLVLLHYLVVGPLMVKVEDGYDMSSIAPKDVRALVGLEIPFLVAFCIVSLFGMTVTIYASAITFIRKSITLKALLIWIWSTWKKPAITWLYVSSLTVTYIILLIVLIRLIAIIATVNATYVCHGLVGILAVLFYLYLAAVWTLGLVISALEDDCHGAKALGKARKLIRGRKLQGYFLMLILVLLSIPIYILFYVTSTDDDDNLGPMTQFAFGFIATVLLCLAKFFTFVVYTVFYYECKKINGEKIEMELESGYCLVPTELQVDTSLL